MLVESLNHELAYQAFQDALSHPLNHTANIERLEIANEVDDFTMDPVQEKELIVDFFTCAVGGALIKEVWFQHIYRFSQG